MARCAASAAPRTAALFSSRSVRAASPAPWNAAARPVVCALLYRSAAWLATSTAWLLGVDLAQFGREERGERLVGGTRPLAEEAESPGGVLLGGRQVAHLLAHRLGLSPQIAGVVAHDERGAGRAQRDDEQDHGADEQRRALPPAATVAATAGRGARWGRGPESVRSCAGVPEAGHHVIVGKSRGLHERVHGGRADEPEAAALEVAAQRASTAASTTAASPSCARRPTIGVPSTNDHT